MLSFLKKKRSRNSAIADSQHWKHHPQLQDFLQTMRGNCTVVPIAMHEALTAVVNIALQENTWTQVRQIPSDFLTDTAYIIWNAPLLPVFLANREELMKNLVSLTAVEPETFLVSQTMDRVVRLIVGEIHLYSVCPEDSSPGEGCIEDRFAI